MLNEPLMVFPVKAPVQHDAFDLFSTIPDALQYAGVPLQDGDVLAVSSKYCAISQGRVVDLASVQVSARAADIATRYRMHPQLTELVLQEADHVFGGIIHDFNGTQLGFLLTHIEGIVSPNAGLDRSNIPYGKVVLFPEKPYPLAAQIRAELRARLGVDVGIILTDSWLMPGRWGTTGVALACAGFQPVQDERGKLDLFGNPMQVTQRGIADSLTVCAQMVMGETAEATPLAVIRNAGIELVDLELSAADVSIDWNMDIYIGALTVGLLEDGAPLNTPTERYLKSKE